MTQLFDDPTDRVVRRPGPGFVAVAGGSQTVTVRRGDAMVPAIVAGPEISAGQACSLIKANGQWFAIGRWEGIEYPNAIPGPLTAWSGDAPASLAIRFFMQDNPRRYRYRVATVTGVEDGYATATIEGRSMRVPIVWDGRLASVPTGAALAYRPVGADWQIVGRLDAVWEWAYSNSRSYVIEGDYDGPEEWYDDYGYVHEISKRVRLASEFGLRDGWVDADELLTIGTSYPIAGAVRSRAVRTRDPAKTYRYGAPLDPNAQYQALATQRQGDPEPAEVTAAQATVDAWALAYPRTGVNFDGNPWPDDGWAPWQVVIASEYLVGGIRYFDWVLQYAEVYATTAAEWTVTEVTSAALEGVYA